MRVYLYINGMCIPHPTDPALSIGAAKYFSKAKEAEDYILALLSTMTQLEVKNSRILITNDDVTFDMTDAYVLRNEALNTGTEHEKIRELPIKELGAYANKDYKRLLKKIEDRAEARRKMDKGVRSAPTIIV